MSLNGQEKAMQRSASTKSSLPWMMTAFGDKVFSAAPDIQIPNGAAAVQRNIRLDSMPARCPAGMAIARGGFNRSMQQLDGIVQPVYRSLVSCV
ncbi:hypothetical protein, partial [Burkholderia cepacia]|uniref:hypothetical protein n=1 Tax=Burkholderia cepacia TaxID=292 RepID=UPI001C400438